MDHLSYTRVNNVGRNKGHQQQRGTKGFRVNSRRFSVHRLRARFFYFIRILSRWNWRSSLGSLKRGVAGCRRSGSRRGLVMEKRRNNIDGSGSNCNKFRSFARSNSFYSEAIADCLEFIKRSSISVDERSDAER